jgi:urea transport system permease protein
MEWFSEFGAIIAMQGFNGLSVFCVLLLMALGLAIIFGQMGVINMAHGEFLTIGAYTTYLLSSLTMSYAPAFLPYYFFFAIVGAFLIAFAIGYLVEWGFIRHLYRRRSIRCSRPGVCRSSCSRRFARSSARRR